MEQTKRMDVKFVLGERGMKTYVQYVCTSTTVQV